jgi:hypothetical protein
MRVFWLLLASALAGTAALAQSPAALPLEREATEGRNNQRIERIRVEDAGSRVEEVRYGGQTQSITVQPKVNVPEYEIVPSDGARSQRPYSREGGGVTSQRVWNVLNF